MGLDESCELTLSLRSMGKHTRAVMRATLYEIDMQAGRDEFIQALPAQGSMRVGVLADILRVRSATVSKMADRLARAGLICRAVDVIDGRRTQLTLTPDGVAKKACIEALMDDLERELEAEFSDGTGDAISMLTRLDDALSIKLQPLR